MVLKIIKTILQILLYSLYFICSLLITLIVFADNIIPSPVSTPILINVENDLKKEVEVILLWENSSGNWLVSKNQKRWGEYIEEVSPSTNDQLIIEGDGIQNMIIAFKVEGKYACERIYNKVTFITSELVYKNRCLPEFDLNHFIKYKVLLSLFVMLVSAYFIYIKKDKKNNRFTIYQIVGGIMIVFSLINFDGFIEIILF